MTILFPYWSGIASIMSIQILLEKNSDRNKLELNQNRNQTHALANSKWFTAGLRILIDKMLKIRNCTLVGKDSLTYFW